MNRPLLVKIGTILALALVLIVPFRLVSDLISERRGLRDRVIQEIAQNSTGTQRLEGIALVIPCTETYDETETLDGGRTVTRARTRSCDFYLLPERMVIVGDVDTDFRNRGIYRALVYRSRLQVDGYFTIPALPAPPHVRRTWEPARLVVGISEIRGIRNAPRLEWNGASTVFAAGTGKAPWPRGIQAPVAANVVMGESVSFALKLDLAGMERIEFVPAAAQMQARLRSSWPHPGFIGRYLPDARTISAQGFDASWHTSDLSTNVQQAFQRCVQAKCDDYLANAFGVAFVQTVDVYQQAYRAVRYGMLFVLLTFTVFFLYEVLAGLRVHPVQYALVGVALAIFFLLLIAFSEHIAFALAYLSAALACIGLITLYVRYVLGSWARGGALAGLLGALYGAMYVVLGSEDYALVMGALLTFAALAVFMVLTRRLDWYSLPGRVGPAHLPGNT